MNPAPGSLLRWRPPQLVTVTLVYDDGEAEQLWTTEAVFPPNGAAAHARWFLAVGPAGKPLKPVVQTLVSGLPASAHVIVQTCRNSFGEVVFGRINYQLN